MISKKAKLYGFFWIIVSLASYFALHDSKFLSMSIILMGMSMVLALYLYLELIDKKTHSSTI